MNLLFLHQNFPGQFLRLARAFAEHEGWTVVGVGRKEQPSERIGPVKYYSYGKPLSAPEALFPPLEQFGEDVRRGRSVAETLSELRKRGFRPDVIVAHPGWGDAIFVREVFPEAALLAYLEYFYHGADSDLDFDPEFPPADGDRRYIRLRNLTTLLAFESADLCVTPTKWQASRFPASIRPNLKILHEGIDTERAAPNLKVEFRLPTGRILRKSDEVVTYVSRSLEPYRGFHVFMRALPELLRRRPNAVVLVVGRDDVSYGRAPVGGGNWRETLIKELDGGIDASRVFFLGHVPYDRYLQVLQVSTVHVYLTYPFVLSWSLLEAMAAGCAIVASSTGPVTEVIADGRNGRLVDFFDPSAIAHAIEELLADGQERARLQKAARRAAVKRYDFRQGAYGEYRTLLAGLVGRPRPVATTRSGAG